MSGRAMTSSSAASAKNGEPASKNIESAGGRSLDPPTTRDAIQQAELIGRDSEEVSGSAQVQLPVRAMPSMPSHVLIYILATLALLAFGLIIGNMLPLG
jgi:hypothetical protein